MIFLRQSTAQSIQLGPFVDSADGVTAETGLTLNQGNVRLSKNGGAWGDLSGLISLVHTQDGWYTLPLTTTDTNTVGRLQIKAHVAGALPVWMSCQVIEEVVYDALFAASAAGELAVKLSAQGKLDVNAEADTALSDYDAPTNAEMVARTLAAADYATAAGQTTLDGKLDTIDGIVDDILVDTGTTLEGHLTDIKGATFAGATDSLEAIRDRGDAAWATASGFATSAALTTVEGKIDTIDGNVDAILVDTGTTLEGHLTDIKGATFAGATDSLEAIRDRGDAAWATASGFATRAALTTVEGKIDTIDGNVDAILVDTAEIGAAGAGLTAIPWNAAWDAEVQSEVADALDEQLADSVAADGTRPTMRQAIYLMHQFLTEFAISGATYTVKKVDGVTTLAEFTLDDASSPTGITRSG